ncbi:MAG: isoleucine--tRNA ligase [Actinomycetota bacterium]|nr:isoleucine--tRNA ligase [Actinomycetota bacterium]
MRFEAVDTKASFPDLEREILAFWNERDIFRASLAQREGAPLWMFYEGPPTANGKPGVHHVEPRTFKDVYPRFKTMTGHFVPRKGGWDCHGLPVELEVEKEIGTTGKRDIEAFGIAAFNARCRESVRRYVGDFERLTERIGYWVDLDEAYWTMAPGYVESVWWSLKSLFVAGLLQEADKVTAYCPRCGTALSDAEVAQGYRTVEDPSVFLRFPIVSAPQADLVGTSMVVWTTTPWTLPSNTGVAVDPDADYVEVSLDGERLIVAAPLREAVLGDGGTDVRRFAGTALVGARYEPPYANVEGAHSVVAGGFVTMDDGTGIVHLAPAFGAEDLAVGRAQNWSVHKPVGDDGRFTELAPAFVRGLFVKDADPKIVEDLRERGVLLRSGTYEHSYPFCWRCKTPLLYYARTSWYVRTTQVKDRLLAVNDDVHWYPEHIKRGRYGNWLENNVDWALSRERYWGTPLPIWRCDRGHLRAIGSLTELGELAGRDVSDVDPHRPAIDEVTFPCPECSDESRRVPEVIDAWYDSGAMPFAQWGYHPDLGRGIDEFERHFPADFISEAIDQTRGWFYTLMAEGVLHFDSTAYRNVVCLGHIIAADGRKMSKSLGNIFDPWEALDRQGADALRWFMITNGSPWASRRIGHEVLDDVVRRFLLTVRHVHAFFVTYAEADGFDPSSPAPPVVERPVLDRWVLSQLAGTAREARDGLDAYDATGAGRRIERFVDDLSNWYVRRSRRRFWNPGGEAERDAAAAFHTLYECLVTLSALLAPFTPFIADTIWRNLAAGRDGHPESVHLADYPSGDEFAIDGDLDAAMRAARSIVGLGRTVRTETKTRVRQPLAEAVVHLPGSHEGLGPLLDVVADELNVRRVVFAESAASFGRWHAKPNFKALGPRLGARVQEVAAALAADEGDLAGALAAGESISVPSSGGEVSLGPDDVDLSHDVREGWGVASDAGITLALDLHLTDDLRTEGVARELIRAIQDARKAAGLEVADRIQLGVEAGPSVSDAFARHRETVANETLAVDVIHGEVEGPAVEATIDDELVRISVRRADYASPADA